jgi:ferredoxin-NADP reductase
MYSHLVKVVSIDKITPDVLRIVTEKPQDYNFKPGQATDLSINKNGWQNKENPFTFTSLPDSDFLEFTIKTYPLHKGFTNELLYLKNNDELIVHDVFGAIAYRGEGVFIAGGAGVTPFISIFRYLKSINEVGNNKLICANNTKDDIILEDEFKDLLGDNFINILANEKASGYNYGKITEHFIKENSGGLNKIFYVCGPPAMMESIKKQLSNLKVDDRLIVVEKW